MSAIRKELPSQRMNFAELKAAALPVAANINSVRGLACLLVVALHVVGDTATTGLHVPMTSGWHYAMISIEFLRIPMFTALSGYLYASRRVTRGDLGRFWTKKGRRLGVPLVSATIVEWYLRQHAYGESTPLWQALVFSFGHLWYIQTLILLFLAISVCDAFFRPGTGALVLAGLTAIMVAQADVTLPTFFSLYGVAYLAPYFLFGIILRERPEWLADPRTGTLSLGIVVIILTAQQLGLLGLTSGVTLLQLPAALAGMAGVTFLLQRLPRNATSRDYRGLFVHNLSVAYHGKRSRACGALASRGDKFASHFRPVPYGWRCCPDHSLPHRAAASAAERDGNRRALDFDVASATARAAKPYAERPSTVVTSGL